MLASKGVDKETLVKNFLNRIYQDDYKITYRADLPIKTVENKVKLQFLIYHFELLSNIINWQEFVSKQMSGSNGIVIMYDITNADTLTWVSEIIQIIRTNLEETPPILLVGNKLDLKKNREVSKELLKKFLENNDISSSIEVSLTTGKNVEKLLMKLTRIILRNSVPVYNNEVNNIEVRRLTKEKISQVFLIVILLIITSFIVSAIMYWVIYIYQGNFS